MNAAIYARVSREEQHTENQVPELRAFAQAKGWEPLEYLEEASGKEGGKRPVLAQLLEDAKARKFQVVLVVKMDRFGRSTKDFLNNLSILNDAGVRFITTGQPIDTDQRSPIGKMMAGILMLFAEFERDIIIERVNAGVARYAKDWEDGRIGKSKHSKSGKDLAHGRPKKVWKRAQVAILHQQGMSLRKIGATLGVNECAIRRALKAQA